MKNPRISKPLAPTQTKDKKLPIGAQMKPRSVLMRESADRVLNKANIALDEGRMIKEKRLFNRSNRIKKRANKVEQRESDYNLKKRGFNNMSRDGIA